MISDANRHTLGPFEQNDDTLAAIGAHADNRATTGAHCEKLFDTLAEISSPGSSKRVTNGDGATIWIDATPRKWAEVSSDARFTRNPIVVLEGSDIRKHLRSKSLVDFPEVNVFITQAVTFKEPRNGIRRSHQEALIVQID